MLEDLPRLRVLVTVNPEEGQERSQLNPAEEEVRRRIFEITADVGATEGNPAHIQGEEHRNRSSQVRPTRFVILGMRRKRQRLRFRIRPQYKCVRSTRFVILGKRRKVLLSLTSGKRLSLKFPTKNCRNELFTQQRASYSSNSPKTAILIHITTH